MRIKSLQVHGFKSFVDRTVFQFQEGCTAVVGPNGCGKSNVVDAVRWVMGEQSPRRLRGKGMEDVIFAGSDSRPPIGMAEVLLTFDNADGQAPPAFAAYGEIQIARRLYRSGESEYLINKTACRLRDIQDFFRDSGVGAKGYTIVEQGRIAEIVSARPEERRILIEEAAGISKYKARRREAESKIASTEQNLVRVNDVLGEIKRQIASLERQAKKAARYKRLQETLRVLDLSIARDERDDLTAAVDTAARRLREMRDNSTALELRVSEREAHLEERRIAVTESEKAVSRGSEALYGLRSEIKEFEGRIELARREREALAESNQGRQEELAQLRQQQETAEREARDSREELRRLELALGSEADNISGAEAESRAAAEVGRELEQDRERANEGFVGVLTEVARSEDRLSAVEDRREEIAHRLRSTDQELEVQQTEATAANTEEHNLEDGLRNLLAERDRFQDQLIKALNNHERAVGAARDAGNRVRALSERHEARKARLDSLREVVERREDLGAGTRHLLGQSEELRSRYGVRGLVREILEVDPEVERAVEAVLADRTDALIVERAEGAVEALRSLRSEAAGRGVLLVEPPAEVMGVGIVPLGQPLLERVRPRPGFEGVARSLLAGVNLVPDLSEAIRAYGGGRMPATFVTPDGDTLTPDGVMRGGAGPSHSGSLTRLREVRELDAEVSSQEHDLAELEASNVESETALAKANEELENLRNRHHTAALAVANHEKDLERTRERVKAIGEAREGRVAERSGTLAEVEALSEEKQRLERRLEELRGERATKQRGLDALGLKISSAAREASRFEIRVTELRVEHSGRVDSRNRLAESTERATLTARDTSDWISRREREISAGDERRALLAEQVQQAESGLAGKLDQEEAARLDAEQLRERFETESAQVRGVENEVRETRSKLNFHREEATTADLAVRECELKLGHLDEATREKWSVQLAYWSPPDPGAEPNAAAESEEPITDQRSAETDGERSTESEAAQADAAESVDPEAEELSAADVLREARRNAELARRPREARQRELEKVRGTIRSLGDVNLGAIEEHEELAERARFLSEQQADLHTTIQSLREAITRINRTSRRRFRETFEAVSKAFSENFPRMFGGGKASLQLTDSEDILEAGIDILAQPPGKRLQNVNLLSGGEKTMTALALLVAVFQVRPSPFFLLDEVDAALDDANVGRFNQLIGEMAKSSQFLIITHNKRTIEVADKLYGVTMEQKGVSKLVAVEMH